jgi:hypothetical protein
MLTLAEIKLLQFHERRSEKRRREEDERMIEKKLLSQASQLNDLLALPLVGEYAS